MDQTDQIKDRRDRRNKPENQNGRHLKKRDLTFKNLFFATTSPHFLVETNEMYEIDEINEMDQINQIFAYSFCIMEGGGILRNNSDGEKSLKSYLTNLTTSPRTGYMGYGGALIFGRM